MGALYRDLVRKHSKAKGSARALLNILADYATDEGLAWPTRETLASDTGMSERNVTRGLQKLCADGQLSIEENAGGGRGRVPVYKLLVPERVKGDNLSPKRATDCHPLDAERVTNGYIKGDKLSIKGDKSVEIPSHARREPQEPKEEPQRERAPARGSHEFFDPRKFVNGRVPAGTGTTPAEVFYEIHTVKDERQVLSSHALATISEQVDDLAKWRTVVSEWELCDFKATNVRGQLEWYRNGIPKHGPPSSNGVHKNGALSEAEKSKILTRARTAQGNIRMAEQFKGKVDPAWLHDIETAKGYGLI